MPGTPSDCPGSMNLSMLCTEPNYSVHVIWQADSIRLLWILIISTKQTSQPHFACMNTLGCHLRSATPRRHFNASCSRRCCFYSNFTHVPWWRHLLGNNRWASWAIILCINSITRAWSEVKPKDFIMKCKEWSQRKKGLFLQ